LTSCLLNLNNTYYHVFTFLQVDINYSKVAPWKP
jgi:hypothetical protein